MGLFKKVPHPHDLNICAYKYNLSYLLDNNSKTYTCEDMQKITLNFKIICDILENCFIDEWPINEFYHIGKNNRGEFIIEIGSLYDSINND